MVAWAAYFESYQEFLNPLRFEVSLLILDVRIGPMRL